MKVYTTWTAECLGGEHKGETFDAHVPGNVQKDYGAKFGLGDVNYSDNYLNYEPLERFFWIYRTTINIKNFDHPGDCYYFVTEGVEYEYDILVDDLEKIVHHEGMYSKSEVDLTDILSDGADHVVAIRIYPHPTLADAPKGRSEAAQCCKPPVEYDWDWHPRMLVSGIFGDTYFESRTSEMIADFEVFYQLCEDLKSAHVTFNAENYKELWTGTKSELIYTVTAPDGTEIYCGTDSEITLDDVRLWWCNGQGEPNLYTCTAQTVGADNETAPAYVTKIGFRTVELVMNEGAWDEPILFPKGRSAAPITIKLNGRPVFGRGSNWVNPEIYTSNIADETYDTLLQYAKECHMNILRIWGGAIINRERFFEDCDKLGIMVWQEFPLACNNYVGSPHYLKVLEQEARALIHRIRRHPSHVIWCGGNELFNNWSGMTDQSLALRLLNKLCYELDQHKPYIPTAPITGMGHGHYVVYDYRRQCLIHKVFGESRLTAYTEFGVPSISDLSILKATIPEADFAHVEAGTVWERRKGFGVWPEGGDDAWSCFNVVDLFFGKQEKLEDYIEKTQWMQQEGYRFVFEEGRRQKPLCSLVMNWDYCEPWNNVSGHSLIAYPTTRRNAYYAVQTALRPVMPSARTYDLFYTGGDTLKAELWMLNDSPEEISDCVEAYLIYDGKEEHILTWNAGTLPANTNKQGHMIQILLPETTTQIMTLRLKSAHGVSDYQFYVTEKMIVERDANILNA